MKNEQSIQCCRNILTINMSRFIFAILVVLAVCSATVLSQERRCPPNEVFKTCGTACEPSCQNPRPEICTMQCKIGCQCRSGFLRNSQGRCVRPSDCP